MELLDYEMLVEDFETKLVTKLRSFGPQTEYLEMWVPDSDTVKSLLNMIEAAQAYGKSEISVSVSRKLMPPEKINHLIKLTDEISKLKIDDMGDKLILTARLI